jgi:hypothetical protein
MCKKNETGLGQHIVVFDEKTDEVIFAVDCKNIDKAIMKKGYGYAFYDGVEPVFCEAGRSVRVKHNACVAKVHIGSEDR